MNVGFSLNISKEIEVLFNKLVSIRSDTGTVLEKDVEEYIYNWISKIEYFNNNPQMYGKYPLKNDYLGRSVVWALLKGNGKRTVILLHHHDVVDALDYGSLMEYAYSPDLLKEKLHLLGISKDVKSDLDSGEWIFGRGTADMKAGAAIQLTLLKQYSKIKDFNGNILLLSVPDEEALSSGMREGVNLLVELKHQYELDYTIIINSEPHEREKSNIGALYEGSVGKIMPLIYVRGKKAHIKDVFSGFNPMILLNEIVKRTELNPDFSDVIGDEVSPPPSWLYSRDRKKFYDVSIPEAAGGYFNILTLKRTPKDILKQLKEICEEATKDVTNFVSSNYEGFKKKTKIQGNKLKLQIKVKSFNELYGEALSNSGEKFVKDYTRTIEKIKDDIQNNKISIPESTFVIIEKTLEYVKDLSPMVIIAFSPPYYPHVSNIDFKGLSKAVLNLNDTINDFSKHSWNEEYKKYNYFMGISDMSYVALTSSEEVIPYIGPNMPLWGNLYNIPFEHMKELSIPAINIGPWGKDLHKLSERVLKRDLLERTPKLIKLAIENLLKG
ncbi:M20/M25/M40 family metallo-hydrolase [Paramaledivibacter caminithermalis]|uniref:Arginine utilization protein RocB n=1 Tax=Paramaledivibacter caminithermalis (strain DSM 15212 / CIP 107654 / DViRD3) TaxID=1121301 RepID=A0A1M6QEJ3_PARC5|nr:M20/M25/M40 family metallo-hydrolase [Paramaledivibacter caminithermalis]SHK18588.1 Arginine utilization protein RocB [Paramaledivibacter caminithermalis DSM 15212]